MNAPNELIDFECSDGKTSGFHLLSIENLSSLFLSKSLNIPNAYAIHSLESIILGVQFEAKLP